ncbi:hypothetical protein [Micromonospora coxensis]
MPVVDAGQSEVQVRRRIVGEAGRRTVLATRVEAQAAATAAGLA